MTPRAYAAFVAVGTELTSGELVNSNSAWVSAKLEDFGLEVRSHITVPDDRVLILEALQIAARQADFIFVSGGLGPTKDDFTRELIAEWSGQPLVRDEDCVKELREKFAAIGRAFHAFQEQQCEFPQGAKVIKNLAGTANAFYLKKNHTHLWTLPGPPREIASVWPEISEQLSLLASARKSLVLKSWLCFGEGESTIAKLTEDVVQNTPFQTGYRAHAPYVEVKIWGEAEHFKAHKDLEKLTKALQPYLISRERKTYSCVFAEKIKTGWEIVDGVSRGELFAEMNTAFKQMPHAPLGIQLNTLYLDRGFDQSDVEEFVRRERASSQLYFVLPSSEEKEFWVGKKDSSGLTIQRLQLPPQLKVGLRFQALWAAEKACALWLSL